MLIWFLLCLVFSLIFKLLEEIKSWRTVISIRLAFYTRGYFDGH